MDFIEEIVEKSYFLQKSLIFLLFCLQNKQFETFLYYFFHMS